MPSQPAAGIRHLPGEALADGLRRGGRRHGILVDARIGGVGAVLVGRQTVDADQADAAFGVGDQFLQRRALLDAAHLREQRGLGNDEQVQLGAVARLRIEGRQLLVCKGVVFSRDAQPGDVPRGVDQVDLVQRELVGDGGARQDQPGDTVVALCDTAQVPVLEVDGYVR